MPGNAKTPIESKVATEGKKSNVNDTTKASNTNTPRSRKSGSKSTKLCNTTEVSDNESSKKNFTLDTPTNVRAVHNNALGNPTDPAGSSKKQKKPMLWTDMVDEYEANIKCPKTPTNVRAVHNNALGNPIDPTGSSKKQKKPMLWTDMVDEYEANTGKSKKTRDNLAVKKSTISENANKKFIYTDNTAVMDLPVIRPSPSTAVRSPKSGCLVSALKPDNSKEVPKKGKGAKKSERELINSTANQKEHFTTYLDKTPTGSDSRANKSEKPVKKTKNLMEYSSRPWIDMVNEYKANRKCSKPTSANDTPGGNNATNENKSTGNEGKTNKKIME